MHVPVTTGFANPTLAPAASFLQRLAARLAQPTPEATGVEPEPASGPTSLTPALLRATLMEMGVAADAENLALAEAFARLGLPLTRESLAEANGALARAPGASPLAYALARSWLLPTTPAALRALSTVTGGAGQAPPQQALPAELMSWLSLTADTRMEPEALAAHLFVMAQGFGRSTENRVAGCAAQIPNSLATLQDTHTTLLRLAEGSADKGIRRGADALAAHIEGQQLINQAARRSGEDAPSPFYLAVPIQFDQEQTLAEMRLWTWDEQQETEDLDGDTPYVRATVRVATARLGRVQAEITGTLAGALKCRLGAEKPATARLLHRHASTLAGSLAVLGGWSSTEVQCRTLEDWTPLWFGADALSGPRQCVDWRA